MLRRFAAAALFPLLIAACVQRSTTTLAPSTPPSPSTPPAAPVARLAVRIDSRQSLIAIQGLSSVTFDASGSSGTGLRYALDFGDGQGADAAVARHIYQSGSVTGKNYVARAIVTDALGRVDTASVSLLVKHAEGQWYSSFYNSAAKRYESRTLDIVSHIDSGVKGQYTHPEYNRSPFTGNLSGERDLTLAVENGVIVFTSEAGSGADGFNSEVTRFSVLMRGGSANGQILVFSRGGGGGGYLAPTVTSR